MFSRTSFLTLLTTSLLVAAQAPPYQGALLVQPGSNSGFCLTAASNTDGAAVTLQPCAATVDQKWTFKNNQVQVYGSKCLDLTNGANVDGTKLQIWTCSTNGGINQQWAYTGYGDNRLQWKGDTRKCMDLPSGQMTAGNRIQIWSCSYTSVGDKNPNQIWNVGYNIGQLPKTSEIGQSGTNACGTTSSQTSKCQTAYLNGADDFCLWAPTSVGKIGDTERDEVAWCTKSGRGTRVIPNGTLKGVHWVKTPDYVQVTGVGDFTKINVQAGDAGGELDPHGADGNGNPVGGLVYGNSFGQGLQYHEWTSFISSNEFCFRACVGPNAQKNCQHIYDEMGCYWNMPANYDAGVFESCVGDDTEPMGVYGGTSTWHQGTSPTPSGHARPKSSSCTTYATIASSPAKREYTEKMVKRYAAPEPMITPPPS